MATKTQVYSNLAIPPGEYLEEVIRELGMTKDELALRMNRPASKLSPMFKGDKAITPDTALQLEKVVGVPAQVWSGLEAEYRLTLARSEEQRQRDSLVGEASLVQAYCYNALAKLGAVAKQTRAADKVLELQRFFGVTSLERVPKLHRYEAAFRCAASSRARQTPEALAAWLRLGEVKAQRVPCAPFRKAKLEETIQTIRGWTLQSPQRFQPLLQLALSEAGVALVVCPHLPSTKAHGATFWVGKDKAALLITIRGSWADIFWFSLLHEIGHILLHDRQNVILEDCDGDPQSQTREAEADQFARDRLIPADAYHYFVSEGGFYPSRIQRFAEQIGIHAGVVVGRLQHEKHLKPAFGNELRCRLKWADAQ
jgi:HTH-type transcriptional regulator/antitoxin HigA